MTSLRQRLDGLGPASRLGLFTAGLAVVLVGGLGVGAATGDQGDEPVGRGRTLERAAAEAGHPNDHGATGSDHAATGTDHTTGTAEHTTTGTDHAAAGSDHAAASTLGTSAVADGLRLDTDVRILQPFVRTPFVFTVRDADGRAVTDFELEQEKRLHLVVVERDLQRFAHLHPTMAADGTWTQDLALSPGSYRVVADATVGGVRRALGVDLVVPGATTASALPAPAPTTSAGGLDVALDRQGQRLAFTVTRDGAPVALQPYLGAQGHLVAFRAGDLAYTHLHPVTGTAFEAALPGPGTYRLFLEVQVDGRVRTAAFTLEQS